MMSLRSEEAWEMAAAAAAALRDRISLMESGNTGASMDTKYEGLNITVLDPTSHAFAQLRQRQPIDYAEFARETRRAISVFSHLALVDGYSPHENAPFWMQVLQETGINSPHSIQDYQHLFTDQETIVPTCRVTFQPKDCYDEDLHEPAEAYAWINAFIEGMLEATEVDMGTDHPLSKCISRLQSLQRRQRVRVPLQVTFKVPMWKLHEPTGSTLIQHLESIRNAHQQWVAIKTRSVGSVFEAVGPCSVALRGTVRAGELCAIASSFTQDSRVCIAELCMDISEAATPNGLHEAVQRTGICSLTVNVAKATVESITQLSVLLKLSKSIRTLRVFNAFTGNEAQRRALWMHFLSAVAASQVEELLLERTHLEADDLRAAMAQSTRLKTLKLQPVIAPNISVQAYLQLLQAVGVSVEHVDVSALCLRGSDCDTLLQACPRLRSLRLGSLNDVESSDLIKLLQEPSCQLSSLALSCSNADALLVAAALSNQPLDVALSCAHLRQLQLTFDTEDNEISAALLRMLDTNHSLQFVHFKSRNVHHEAPHDSRFAEHDSRQLVRKLPTKHKLAFLSAISSSGRSASASALQYFDSGAASEILSFAGHSVQRRLRFA